MFRKLSLALAVSAALSSTGALALGLGEISTNSALNENFNADIELVSVEQGEIEGISVTLASAADFDRKGLDRPFLLSKLRFKTMLLDDGRAVVRVTTREAVREPFLNFLVEINWPKGRLIREFTVLLDPPVTLDREPQTILPVVAAPVEAVEISRPVRERYAQAEERYIPVPKTAAPPATTAGKYGPVARGMTLWRIAREMDVAGASTEQVAMALFRSNPDAFVGNNINILRAGAILRVPDREAVFSQSPQQAQNAFHARPQRSTGPKSKADRLQIATVPAEVVADTDIDRVKTDLMLVRETGESTRQETEELRSRIRELEAQLADIRQLLKLKSDQLAALQAASGESTAEIAAVAPDAGVEEAPAEAAEAPEVEDEAAMAAVAAPEVEEEAPTVAVEESEPLLPEETVALAPTEIQESEPVVEAPAEPEPAAAVEPVAAVEPALQAEPEPQPVQPPATAAPPAKSTPEPGLMDRLFSDTKLLGIAAAVAVALLSLAWLLIRRRRETEGQFDESALLASDDSAPVELGNESEIAQSLYQEDETSFISDFSPSDIDALQEETGEVDPAAEADVYIAYGRYQQAESLINQAIEKTPDRLDLKLKLLEIYFTTRNAASFTALAEQLESAGAPEKDPQLWARVQSMGRELVPGRELFGTGEPGEEASALGSTMDGSEEETLVSDSEALASLDLDLDSELSEIREEVSPGGAGFDEDAALEPPPMAEPEGTAGQGAERVAALDTEEEDLEFAIDLSDLDTLEDIDLGDLGLDSEELGTEQPDQPLTAAPEVAVKAAAEEPISEVIAKLETEPEDTELELSQFDLDEPETVELEGSEPLPEMFEEAEEGAGESETKLDLARAYLEMGDADGASEFLGEVLQDGSDEQKSAAKELLDKIT